MAATTTQNARLAAAERGCLVIADISGYTRYLMGTELEHAQDVLADLMETVATALQPILRLSKLEGDAAFAYAPASGIDPSMLLDTVDRAYFSFRSRLRDVAQATTCTCNACMLIPDLNLKFAVHHGQFVRRPVAGSEELTGADVVLVHRLLKNSVAETFGWRGYALFSAACVETMGVDAEALGMHAHRERYEDVGEIAVWVTDLEARWHAEQERRRVYVVPDRASFEWVGPVTPLAPEALWQYLTVPEKRAVWLRADRLDQQTVGGRRGAGTVTHCVHGRDVRLEEILDWRPFRYFTSRWHIPAIGPWAWTYELEQVEGGTRVRVRGDRLTGKNRLLWVAMRRPVMKELDAAGEKLLAMIADESGRREQPRLSV